MVKVIQRPARRHLGIGLAGKRRESFGAQLQIRPSTRHHERRCRRTQCLGSTGKGAFSTPNVKATQAELYQGLTAERTSGRPSLHFDYKGIIGSVGKAMMPPGFYSKTFKWPPKLWPTYENVIRHLPDSAARRKWVMPNGMTTNT